nr:MULTISPECIES: DUF992 domain-containing protein [unclassified Rhizobium]
MEIQVSNKVIALVAAALVSSFYPASAARIQAGTLTCDVSAGIGKILVAQQDVDCTFKPTTGAPEHYRGTIAKFGLEIGQIREASLVWFVYGATSLDAGALAGDYVGINADATIGVGLGANVLGGGQGKSIALQPVSVQSEQGVNVAVGTEELKLQFVAK